MSLSARSIKDCAKVGELNQKESEKIQGEVISNNLFEVVSTLWWSDYTIETRTAYITWKERI